MRNRRVTRCCLIALLLLMCLCAGACKQQKEETQTEQVTTAAQTTKEAEVVSVNRDDSVWINGEMLIGKTGNYLGFRDVEKTDWKSAGRALAEGWVLQGGDRIHFGAEKITAFLQDCEAGIPGVLRIQRHFFGMEDTSEQVYLEDVLFDGTRYYYASLNDDGVYWDENSYAAFQMQEVRDMENALATTYYVLNDGGELILEDIEKLSADGAYVWVSAEYYYPVDTIATIYINGQDYMSFDGSYTGFSKEIGGDLRSFYEKAHAKANAALRVETGSVRRDILFDGNKYYLIREDSGFIRTYLHSVLLEQEGVTYLVLSATDGLTWELYEEDPSNYAVYFVGVVE